MKLKTVAKVAKVAGVLLGLLVAAVVVVCLSFDWLLKSAVTAVVTQQTGFPLTIDRLQLGLRDGTLRVQGLTLGNPPGFGDQPLVSLPELYFAYDLAAAATNVIRFHEVRLDLNQVNLIVDAQGRTNLTEIAARLERVGIATQQPLPTNMLGGMMFAGIDTLQLSLGSVRYTDLRSPDASRSIVMGIQNRRLTNVVAAEQFGPLLFEVMIKLAMQVR